MVCLSVETVTPPKMAEPIAVPFRVLMQVGHRDHVLGGGMGLLSPKSGYKFGRIPPPLPLHPARGLGERCEPGRQTHFGAFCAESKASGGTNFNDFREK